MQTTMTPQNHQIMITNRLKLRERLLVERCINSIIFDFNSHYNDPDFSNTITELDLKLDFLSFLNNNLPEEVQYGIFYVKQNKQKFATAISFLYPIILEYEAYGLTGSLNCPPIPTGRTQGYKRTFLQKVKDFFANISIKQGKEKGN